MLQLTVAHGPADLLVAAVTAPGSPEPGWLRWLPHARDPDSGERLVATGELPTPLIGRARSGGPRAPHLMLVLDDPAPLAARNAPIRELLAGDGSAAALVVGDAAASLPSICDVVIDARPDGTAALHRPGRAELGDHVIAAGASVGTARRVALALAGWHDPEQSAPGADLPSAVPLASLLRADGALEPGEVRKGWEAAGSDPPLRTRLAVAADGPVEVDLVRDGPHALVAGTTGAGKSELLRALVAGLAVGTPPDHLAFVLVDYKGGAAFDACARLPHVAGVVTDLDERLAERALRSLHAELRRREHLLRAASVSDLTAYRARTGSIPIPRLVVIVDELASLAHDLPDFVPSLVGVAQRGRSLGVHLVLATQRPAGAISDDVRANTNLRVALRVQDAAESVDIVGVPDAASLPRHRPGRAVLRFGHGECVVAQVASATAGVAEGGVPVIVAPFDDVAADGTATAGPSALGAFVDAVAGAAAGGRAGVRHRPWLPPLPSILRREDLPAGAAGLLDDPDHQAQRPWRWDRSTGHLLCIGGAGSGATAALTTTVLAAATSAPPSELHVYVIDGGGLPDALADLPHVGAVIARTDDERVARIVDRLASRLDGRTDGMPAVLLVVDGLAAWRQVVAERLGSEVADRLDRVLVEGPAVGIAVAATVERPGALPLAVSGAVGERLVFRLGDPADALLLGLRPSAVADPPAGRAVVAGCGLDVQIADVGDLADAIARLAARWPAHPCSGVAPPIDRLPERVAAQHLPEPSLASVTSGGEARPIWSLPIGLDGRTLEVCCMELHAGEHLLVAGPARSGRSTALALLAHQVLAADPAARIVA
ncbi:MAG TPA: FtsK/SpoIIIE domain-containing protein, partial [Acidimicrobiales bacterium]